MEGEVAVAEAPWLYLQLELQLSAVARLLARDGDLAAQLQRHGAIQDAWRLGERKKKKKRVAHFGGFLWSFFASFCCPVCLTFAVSVRHVHHVVLASVKEGEPRLTVQYG